MELSTEKSWSQFWYQQYKLLQGRPSIPLETCKIRQSEILWTWLASKDNLKYSGLISLSGVCYLLDRGFNISYFQSTSITYFGKGFFYPSHLNTSLVIFYWQLCKKTHLQKHELHFLHLSLSPVYVNIGKMATFNWIASLIHRSSDNSGKLF